MLKVERVNKELYHLLKVVFLVKKLEIARHLVVNKLVKVESWNCLVMVNSEFVVVKEDSWNCLVVNSE